MIMQGVQLMLYGLGGVFTALATLYVTVKVLTMLFPAKDEDDKKV